MIRLQVEPKVSQFDSDVNIRVLGLRPKQRVIIRNEMKNELGGKFQSHSMAAIIM
jgi:hypothetical protein